MSLPSKVQRPGSGGSEAGRRLKKVGVPGPLGPSSAVNRPRWISTWSTSTAGSPPKRRVMPSAIRIGSGLGTPGTGSTPASTSAGIELELPAVAEYALWSEDDQQRQPEPHDHEPHLAALRSGDDRLGQQVVDRKSGGEGRRVAVRD